MMMTEEKMNEGKEINAKDLKKVQQLHGELMAMAEKYDMSMEHLLEKCCMPEEEDMKEYEGEDSEEESSPMDKTKIAFIIGKMKPKGE